MNKTNFGLVGGDVRLLYAARRLKSLGYGACFYSPDGTLKTSQDFSDIELLSLCDCVKRAQVIILPLPASRGDGKINCPLLSKELDAGALFSCVRRSTPVFAGKADKCISVAAREAGVRLTDYFTSESLLTSNALYTAEGALSLIISELPRALCGSDVAVFGYGRIASLLTRRLLSLGAGVRVVARSAARRALAQADGAAPFAPERTCDALDGVICAVNTVPARVLSAEALSALAPAALIELADCPGADADEARRAGVRIIPAPSLPGRFSPESAGSLIADTVLSMLG